MGCVMVAISVIALIALVLVIACEHRNTSRRWRANYDAMIADELKDGPAPYVFTPERKQQK